MMSLYIVRLHGSWGQSFRTRMGQLKVLVCKFGSVNRFTASSIKVREVSTLMSTK